MASSVALLDFVKDFLVRMLKTFIILSLVMSMDSLGPSDIYLHLTGPVRGLDNVPFST